MSIQSKYFNKLQAEQTFVDIYSDFYEVSQFGFIIDFNDTFLLLESLTMKASLMALPFFG